MWSGSFVRNYRSRRRNSEQHLGIAPLVLLVSRKEGCSERPAKEKKRFLGRVETNHFLFCCLWILQKEKKRRTRRCSLISRNSLLFLKQEEPVVLFETQWRRASSFVVRCFFFLICSFERITRTASFAASFGTSRTTRKEPLRQSGSFLGFFLNTPLLFFFEHQQLTTNNVVNC